MFNMIFYAAQQVGKAAAGAVIDAAKGVTQGVNDAVNSEQGRQDLQAIKDNLRTLSGVNRKKPYQIKEDNDDLKFNF